MLQVTMEERDREVMRRILRSKESEHLRLKRQKLNRSMFDRVATLGVGAFGEVRFLEKRFSGILFRTKFLRIVRVSSHYARTREGTRNTG